VVAFFGPHSGGPFGGDVVASGAQLNMRAVFLQVLGVALGSVGVIISGILSKFIDAKWKYRIDPALRYNILLVRFSSI